MVETMPEKFCVDPLFRDHADRSRNIRPGKARFRSYVKKVGITVMIQSYNLIQAPNLINLTELGA